MLGYNLEKTFQRLVEIGVVRSRRDYSTNYLQRGKHYARDYVDRGRDGVRVSDRTVDALRERLRAVAQHCSPNIRREVEGVVDDVGRAVAVANQLGLRGRYVAGYGW